MAANGGPPGPSGTLARIFDALRAGDVDAMVSMMESASFLGHYEARIPRGYAATSLPTAVEYQARHPGMPLEVAEYHATEMRENQRDWLPEFLRTWGVSSVEELEQLTAVDALRHEVRMLREMQTELDWSILGEVSESPHLVHVAFRPRAFGGPTFAGAPDLATMIRDGDNWRLTITEGGLFRIVGFPSGFAYYDLKSSTFTIDWHAHLQTAPDLVYRCLATAEGRARFWADSAPEDDGVIRFTFPDGTELQSRILRAEAPRVFECEYFEGSVVTFELEDDGQGGTDLHLEERGDAPRPARENRAGWVSVLLALKAAVDHGVDLRNHDPRRTWGQGFVDN